MPEKQFTEPTPIQRIDEEEPTNVAVKESELKMDVQKPKVYIGLKAKETSLSGEAMLKHELAVQIALELIFGRTSEFYTNVYDSGLIDESYSYDFTLERGFGFALIGTDTSDPDTFVKAVKTELQKAEKGNSFTQEAVERIKRKKIGFYLRALNSIEFIANQYTRYAFNDMNLFDAVPVIETITVADIEEAFKTVQGESQQTVFKILPIDKEND